MARKEYAAEDPLEIVGVIADEPPDDAAIAEMGRCFVEEMARMGWRRNAILNVFRSPFYRGPHMVYERFGEPFVVSMVERLEPAGRPDHGK